MHYDHISFHIPDLPPHVPPNHAAHHIGYYFSWAVSQNLHSQEAENLPTFQLLKSGMISGAIFILTQLNGGIDETCFNKLGNRFTQFYYADEEEYGHFLTDYFLTLDLNNDYDFYCTEDSVENQQKLNPVFQLAFNKWLQSLA